MLSLSRCLLYRFAAVPGAAGLLAGSQPRLKYTDRLEGKDYVASAVLSAYDRFSSEIILRLSLMLLIVARIGHGVGGGLHIFKSRKMASTRKQQGDTFLSAGTASRPLSHLERQNRQIKTDEAKLARLLRH